MTQPADTNITTTPNHNPNSGHGDHGHGTAPAATPFTTQDMTAFHHDDRVAAAAIIMLIGGIFTIGVILYTIVNLVVRAEP